jgi:polysaccharide export outer membrane protein
MILLLAILLTFTPAAAFAQTHAASGTSSDYRVGPEDVLSITVYGEPQLSGKIRVDSDGSFPFQYLGRVKAEGMTTAAVEEALRKGLSDGYLRNPQVSVEVDQYRSQRVFVTGEVRSPNKYLLPGNSTLMDVLTLAGSVTANAGNWVEVRHARKGAGSEATADPAASDIRLRISDVQTGKTQDIRVLDGDTIFVPKAERIFVVGEVRNSGAFAYDEGMTVFQAVSLAGGQSEKGANRYSIRRLIKGHMTEIDAKAEDRLLPGDQVNVKRRRL